MRLNNIKNKRFIIESFKEIKREFGGQYSLHSFEHDPMVLDDVSGFLTKVLNVKDQDDIDFIYASYILNYYNVDGDFSILEHDDEEILIPEEKSFKAVKTEWSQVLFKEVFVESYYLPCMMSWDIEQYQIDPLEDSSCGIENIHDSWDRKITIIENVEISPKPPNPNNI
tara:strand:+ start:2089 stop:2595 length:507 start_codon:yes stop_codon:yes gene_type:complete